MRQRHRQYNLTVFLIILVMSFGCAQSKKTKKLEMDRLATVDYDLITIGRNTPNWAGEFYFLQSQGKLKDPNFRWLKGDDGTQHFIVDSGARVEQEIACPVARAQARELIAQKLVEDLFMKVKGKPFDTLLKGKGLTIMMSELKQVLKKESVEGTYEEGRVFPGNEKVKGQEVYHCALLIRVSNENLNQILTKIKGEIRKDFFHLPNLDQELEPLKFL